MANGNNIKISPWIWFIAIFNVIFHLAFYDTLGYHRDELLYFSLGQHLALGYASVPPFIGFIAWVVIHTLGYTLLDARLIPILLSGIMILLTAGITREMKGKSYAQVLATIAFTVTPFNLRGFSFFMPVCFDVFFWNMIFYLVLRWINTKYDRYLMLLGLFVGIGMMNKYLIALEVFCLCIVFLFASYRNLFYRRAFYWAVGIGIIIFLPNLIWQVINNLPFITHMHALHDSQLVHVDRIAFLTDQFFMGSMAMVLIVPGILFLLSGKTLRLYRPLVFACLLAVFLLVLLRGKSYYTCGMFPLLIAAGGVYWEIVLKRFLPRLMIPLVMVLITLPVVPMGVPVFKPVRLAKYFEGVKANPKLAIALRWEDGKYHALPQDYADMLGWDELVYITALAYGQVPDKQSAMIYAENYGQAGAIMVLGKKYKLPDPACFSESFLYWIPRNPQHEITTLIYINDKLGDDVSNLFSECREIGWIRNPMAREFETGVWLCTHPRSSFNELWHRRVLQVTNPFYH